MKKYKLNQAAIVLFAVLSALSIKLIDREFGFWNTAERMLAIAWANGLAGIFFGIWQPRPVRIVFRDYPRWGLKGIKKLGLITPGVVIFLLLRFQVDGPLAVSWKMAIPMSMLGTLFFWLTAVPVGFLSGRKNKWTRGITRGPSNFLRRFGTGG